MYMYTNANAMLQRAIYATIRNAIKLYGGSENLACASLILLTLKVKIALPHMVFGKM